MLHLTKNKNKMIHDSDYNTYTFVTPACYVTKCTDSILHKMPEWICPAQIKLLTCKLLHRCNYGTSMDLG